MTSEEGLNKWMETYNAEIKTGVGSRIPLPGERSENAQKFHGVLQPRRASGNRKKRRKKK